MRTPLRAVTILVLSCLLACAHAEREASPRTSRMQARAFEARLLPITSFDEYVRDLSGEFGPPKTKLGERIGYYGGAAVWYAARADRCFRLTAYQFEQSTELGDVRFQEEFAEPGLCAH